MTTEERFWEKVEKGNGCWQWTAGTNRHGYGVFTMDGEQLLAHRAAWQLTYGPVPEGEGAHGTCVCHTCDNRLCVNPAHLFLGSHQDNMDDMVVKGRNVRGTEQRSAKLTEDDVEKIRANEQGLSQRDLANLYGVSQPTISGIIRRKKWRGYRKGTGPVGL